MKVFRSTVINAPVETIWQTLRTFDGVAKWNPGVAKAYIEHDRPATEVGCIRHLTLADGGIIRETLLAVSDVERSFTYDIIESALPVRSYVATQHFMPVTDGNRTYTTWSVKFDPDPGREAEMEETIGEGIFVAGFEGMKQYFE